MYNISTYYHYTDNIISASLAKGKKYGSYKKERSLFWCKRNKNMGDYPDHQGLKDVIL